MYYLKVNRDIKINGIYYITEDSGKYKYTECNKCKQTSMSWEVKHKIIKIKIIGLSVGSKHRIIAYIYDMVGFTDYVNTNIWSTNFKNLFKRKIDCENYIKTLN